MARRATALTAPPSDVVPSGIDAARACAACHGPVPGDARFCQWCGSPVSAPAPPGTGSRHRRQRAAVAVGGDRRPVSILFVDIVGSTALLGSMDPEDWRAIINEAFERLVPAIRRYDGTIGQYLGDGFLAFFGAPIAHEDDPARAAFAALDLIEAARGYAAELEVTAGIGFAVRVGLDAGEVVAGEVGAGGSAEYLLVGDAVNSAARLQAVAEPMTALASEAFAGSLRGRFVLDHRGSFALKGLGPPRPAIRVVAPVELERSQVTLPGSTLPLVGRARELDRLRRAVETARAGRSAAVAIVGEPGIGKSRLLAEWRDLATEDGVRWAEAHAVTYGGGSTHHLVASLLRDLAGVDDSDGPDAFIAFVDATLGAAVGPDPGSDAGSARSAGGLGTAGVGPTLAEIVWPGSQANVPSEPRGLLLARRLALQELMAALSATTPLAIVLEDVHRADPASVSLLSSLIAPSRSRLVVAVTSRPDPEASGWPMVEAIRALDAPDGNVIELGPLAPADSTRMVEAILPGGPVPAELVTTVLRRAEGNPLFVEQLVRSLLDQGAVLRADGRWSATDRLDDDAIPSTVQGLLLARIDSLGAEERTAARIGAVIGRRFPGALLAKVGRLAGLALPADLGPLAAAGLIEPASDDGDGYAFRHALVQEAAYASLLRADRARLHGVVARALVAGRRDGLDALAPTLAFHYRRAGDLGRAIRFALLGGDAARSAHANSEALAAYDDVLAMLAELPDGARRARRRIERAAHEGRAEILAWLQRRDEALAANAAAMALLPRGPSLDRARLARERGIVLMTEQRVDEARAMYDIADAILGDRPPADRAGRDEWVHLHLSRATLWYFTGDLGREAHDLDLVGPWVEAEGSLEQRATYLSYRNALALRRDRCRLSDEDADRERRALGIARQVGDPSLAAVFEFSLGLCLLLRDDLDEADEHLGVALAAAEACQDELLVARTRAYRPMLALKRGDLEGCRTLAEEAYEAVSSLGLQEYVALAVAYRAWVAWRDGRAMDVRRLARDAVTTWDGLPFSYPFRWVALLPVMALDLEEGDPAPGVRDARAILHPDQQRLPEALEVALRSAVEAFDANEPRVSMTALGRSLECARSCGYL